MSGWMYKRTEPGLWTVGWGYDDGGFEPESDHGDPSDAAKRVAFLNGAGPDPDELPAPTPDTADRTDTIVALLTRIADGIDTANRIALLTARDGHADQWVPDPATLFEQIQAQVFGPLLTPPPDPDAL